MEPERKIEKLLRAYAKKRRAGAGEPLKLHPATRRLLQGEVARNTPTPDEEDSLSLWQLFRQQWVFIFGFALVMFLGATLLMPSFIGAKHKAQAVSAMSNLKQIGTAVQQAAVDNNGRLPASLDALTNGFLSSRDLTDPASGKLFDYVGGGRILDDLRSNDVLAFSPADKNGRAVLFANGEVQWMDTGRFSELTNQKSFQFALANKSTTANLAGGFAVNAPAAAGPPVASEDRQQTTRELAYRNGATQTNSTQLALDLEGSLSRAGEFGLPNYFTNISASAKAAPVLVNFQVRQNGNKIHIVDNDGSIYDGSLLPVSVAQGAPPPAEIAASPVSPAVKKIVMTNGILSELARGLFFRVAGTNLTSRQNLVFTGNLIASSTTPAETQPTLGGDRSGNGDFGLSRELTNQPPLLPWSNLRITGTAILDNTNKIEIYAAPVTP